MTREMDGDHIIKYLTEKLHKYFNVMRQELQQTHSI